MRSFAPALLFAASAMASGIKVSNNCESSVFITLTSQDGTTTGPTEITAGAGFAQGPISGAGNSLGITTNSDYYSSDTAKLILGTTSSSGTLYWSISDVDGNPFETTGFTIDSPDTNGNDVCGTANSPDGQTRGCPDGDFTLSVDLCTA